MKASQVIQEYKNGKRDFQGLNLRGANFAEKDLSGANFSYCQIQGANFNQANLTGANFTGVKAGLQLRNTILQGFLFCFLAAFPQYFLFQVFKFSTLSIDSNSQIIINIIVFILFLHISSSLIHALSEKFSIIVGTYVVCGIIATAFAFIDIRLTNLELYIILGGITLFITVISAICTGIFWVLYEKWVIYILPILFAIIGFIEGYSRSNESQFSMIIGIIVSVVGWISGIYISKQGLQEEEKYKWVRPIILFITFLIGGTNYFKANLTDADFTSATLKNTNFNQAILTCTCFKDTVKLNLARAGNTILANPTVRDLLINPSNGSGINLFKASLRGANLESANLQEANLTQADISEASFKYANLKHTNLTEVNAVKTNFSDATLTGACVENWNIDTTTILDNVDCQYVYLLNNKKERSPSSGEFQGNEFSKLFEEVFDTVDLIFRNGIDWRAFLSAMNKVQVQNEETPLEVQSIEKKGDGVFVVKVHVPPDADKEKLHEQLVQKYEQEKKELEAEYKSKLAIKNTEIESYKRENTNLMKILEREASRPIQIIQQSHLGDGDNVGNDRTENNNL